MADWCAVDLAQGDGIERVAVAHVDPARVQLARDAQDRYPADPRSGTGVYGVLRRGAAEVYPQISDEMLEQSAHDAAHLELLRSVGLRSAMLVPTAAARPRARRDLVLSAESGRRFDEQDLALAEDLALRAAAAVENARLFETASTIAGTLQASLLPPVLPDRRAGAAAAYRPAGSASRSEATSTTCSAPPRTSGTW